MERVTDNFNLDFPAIMSDGRQFTDYRSNCTLNKMSEQMSSQEYKDYLINNTEQILSNQSKITEQLMGCKSCSDYSIVPPFLSLNCDGDKCTTFVNNPDGIGIARSSDPNKLNEGFTVGGKMGDHLHKINDVHAPSRRLGRPAQDRIRAKHTGRTGGHRR